MSDPDVVCGGGAKPGDTHLLSTVHCIDDEVIEWLKRREERTRRQRGRVVKSYLCLTPRLADKDSPVHREVMN
jgi:hypothetical protein